ncbi:MAG TPA: 3'(2'),5'-bisphosphate nucleotidase CysQ [Caulobacteraceae bacterium]|jgi:3'(2'), 5'-bisphosphate nucleotidase|nr:3'(2'),5'-bisphosphate nucleotidase CysQ [Caulobacteraceae bacterium]
MDLDVTTDIASDLADIVAEAGRLILPLWNSGLTVTAKADESPVTEADRRGEALILAGLASRFPGVPVISEEDASEFGTPDQIGPRFFLVDPLDGTKAFIRGDPHFTVNIGLIDHGQPVAGAVGAPASGELWKTTRDGVVKRRGDGPFELVRPRPWPQGEALALISHTMKVETADALAAQYGFHRREPMDSSIKFCRIAEGAADIYPRHGTTMEWDTAAGHAVLIAAGGQVTTPDGAPFVYGKASEGFKNGWFVARGL